jgi:hypothetical protein
MDSAPVSLLLETWQHSFFSNCEKLHIQCPWLDDEELEARAEEMTCMFFYLIESEKLAYYHATTFWRADMR